MNKDELYHYGVIGMKWGKRKARQDSWSDDAKKTSEIQKKNVKQMSNNELRTANERAQLERNYSQLNPGKIKKGLAIAGGVAAALGTVALLYNNSKQVMKIGKDTVTKFKKKRSISQEAKKAKAISQILKK